MRNEISIQGTSPVVAASDHQADSKGASSTEPDATAQPEVQPLFANPALRLEPALGLVVIEFRDSSGVVTSSIPTERQIEAYKTHVMQAPAPEPGETPDQLRSDEPTTFARLPEKEQPIPPNRAAARFPVGTNNLLPPE